MRPKFDENTESEAVPTLIRPWSRSKSRQLPCADVVASLGVLAPLRIDQSFASGSYVKLVREHDKIVISLYVAAGETASLRGIPSGSYMIAFGTGSIFDRERDSFCIRGAAQMFDRRMDYDVHTAGWELTLQAVSGGNARTSSMSYDDFNNL